MLLTLILLLMLSAAQGLTTGRSMRIPFLYDFAAYTRFLVVIPLLILAEWLIEHHIAGVAAHFMLSRLVPERQFPAYASALDRAISRRNSTLAEVVLLGLAGASVLVVRKECPLDFST